MRFQAWSEEDCKTAAEILRAEPIFYGTRKSAVHKIAKAIDRTPHSVSVRLYDYGPNFRGPSRRLRNRVPTVKVNRIQEPVLVRNPPVDVLAERERRMQALDARDITGQFFGDPAPGWSALDRRRI